MQGFCREVEIGFATFCKSFTEEGFNAEYISNFEQCIWGLWLVEDRWSRLRKKLRKTDVDHLVLLATELRKLLLDGASYLWRDNEGVKEFLRDVKAGSGRWDLADDLQRLADFLAPEWPNIKGRSEITQQSIKDAASCAVQLAKALENLDRKEWQELRLRAWNEFFFLYEKLRNAGLYLYQDNLEEGHFRYPSLYSQRFTPAKKKVKRTEEPVTS